MSDFKTILVATDLSDPSLAALRQASALARGLGSHLILTYVVEDRLPPLVMGLTNESIEQIAAQHLATANQHLAECAGQHLAGCDVEIVVREGVPHREIVALASERKVDLIVIGMHGHGFLRHAMTGSAAERVLHHAPCPVLIAAHSH